MNYEKIEPQRDASMEPLPDSDTLFQFDNGSIVRLRILAKTTEGEVRTQSPEPGVNETINLKFRCSLCKDASGDVREDSAGKHLLLAAEVHGVTAESLVASGQSFDAWLADRIEDLLAKSYRKAHILDEVLARFRIPAEPAESS